jgi:hypothetical protein
MYPFMNEDAAWQRLQDTQREIENGRLMVGAPEATFHLIRRLAVRAWHLAGLAAMRPPRYSAMRHDGE